MVHQVHFSKALITLSVLLSWSIASVAHAHFPWLVPTNNSGSSVELFFGEKPEPDDPKLLSKWEGVSGKAWVDNDSSHDVKLAFSSDKAHISGSYQSASAWSLQHTYGLFGKADSKSLLKYSAQFVPCIRVSQAEQDQLVLSQDGFSAVPTWDGNVLSVQIRRGKEPAVNQSFELFTSGQFVEYKTGSDGKCTIEKVSHGLNALKLKHTEPTPGQLDGQEYKQVLEYTTISFVVPNLNQVVVDESASKSIAELTDSTTSFGAATNSRGIYLFGGNGGSAHSYYSGQQLNHLIQLRHENGATWEKISEATGVQGNAMVADDKQLILVGGFMALNKKGDPAKLESQRKVLRYDLEKKEWSNLPDLPEGRSSFDAAVLDNTLYVVGGWELSGDPDDSKWHTTAWKMSLSNPESGWKALATPPFQRRALALVAYQNQLYAIGGMDESSPTTAATAYDPKHDRWEELSPIIGKPIHGFGVSAAVIKNQLIVSDVSGALQRYIPEKHDWEIVGHYAPGRFFHRMLPYKEDSAVLLGGANMAIGRFKPITVVTVKQ